jgi:putative ATP-dependent endonuclease of OLD family
MKISRIEIKNFRSLRDVSVDVDDYAALVGANGSGKSSILYALDWFFNGRHLSPADVCGWEEGVTPDDECFIEVAVSFTDLTAADRWRLQQYGRGDTAKFRRTWRRDAKDKVVGNALQGPGFSAVRSHTRVGDFRPAYAGLRELHADLPDLGTQASRDQVHAALARWEDDERNRTSLVSVADDDANHMFGINGTNVIKSCVRLVLVPASTDMSSQAGEAGKGSALAELIGAFMAEAGARAQAEWLAENDSILGNLRAKVKENIEKSTRIQAMRVNATLATLIPAARVSLTPSIPEWSPKTDASVITDVEIDGVTNDFSRQGHGVQRAVMMSMLQALVPDDFSARADHEVLEGEDAETAQARLQKELEELPSLIVCIEEPELYQHPVRARSFARTLSDLSEQGKAQVIVATHSPYFVRPEQFSSLRRFTLAGGKTAVHQTNSLKLNRQTGIPAVKIDKIVDKRVPTEFAEGFFADAVALVEGDTDKAVVESVATKLGYDLDALGISILQVSSKESLRIPYELLKDLGIPVFVFVDGDYLGASRKYPTDKDAAHKVHESHRNSTDNIISWLAADDTAAASESYRFGDPSSITAKYVFWHDDLEEELAAWPSFNEVLNDAGGSVLSRNKKDLFAYRNAVIEATAQDLPQTLSSAVQALVAFKSLAL